MGDSRKIVFITGTRADFGKLKPLMIRLQSEAMFEVHIFVTGMHMLSRYGYTCKEVEKASFKNIHKYINQNIDDNMDIILSKTITGLSDYVREIVPDLLLVHGDRVETLAGAIVGSLNNILVGHIEGGEVSGSIDEMLRHAVSKLSHTHFIANESAKRRLMQLGESEDSIYVIGSPDIDVMESDALPYLDDVKRRYQFDFDNYAILIFHPVTTELGTLKTIIREVVNATINSGLNFIVIYPNNDHGTNIIFDEYERFCNIERIKVHRSLRFEYFLTLLKNCSFIMGNSSAGVREAPHYGVPSINLGGRQRNRNSCASIIDCNVDERAIGAAIARVRDMPRTSFKQFGRGNSAQKFIEIVSAASFWGRDVQKHFVDWKPIGRKHQAETDSVNGITSLPLDLN